ncbi:MAG: tRNA (adenine(22)-N(1))-methyltransferase TrmK [Bacteriovoracaceae bacterium]
MVLSPRLAKLAGHYHHHESIWDIGCDHGKLGLSFLNEKEVKAIHLVDPSLPVIDKLRFLIDSYITDPLLKIQIHHENGQDVMMSNEKKLVLIAGMGGKEIESILESLKKKLTPEDDVVISPHRDILQLRKWLHHSVFSLGNESLVWDEGRYYQVISLNLRGNEKVHPFGREIFGDDRGEEYRIQQLRTFSAHKDVRSLEYADYLKTLTQRF